MGGGVEASSSARVSTRMKGRGAVNTVEGIEHRAFRQMLRKDNPGRKQVQLALRRKALKERFIGWFIPVQSEVSQVMELAEVSPYPEILFELSNSVSSESEFNDCKSKSKISCSMKLCL
ncbi:hypothetical protein RIF29_47148 [Crotalaria pallida]|uniref:Uncharacterized protein n=1 Tax=Crotalaria pallida TaxID=3830 RepID=A0AAN9DQS1_CROPI